MFIFIGPGTTIIVYRGEHHHGRHQSDDCLNVESSLAALPPSVASSELRLPVLDFRNAETASVSFKHHVGHQHLLLRLNHHLHVIAFAVAVAVGSAMFIDPSIIRSIAFLGREANLGLVL